MTDQKGGERNRHPLWSTVVLLIFGGGFIMMTAYGLNSPNVNTLPVVPYCIGAILLGIILAIALKYYEITTVEQ